MNNMTVTREGDTLVIKLPIDANPAPSASGKTLSVGSSHGNQKTDIIIQGKPVVVGVNAYIKAH